MDERILIGLAGKARVGKDSFSTFLADALYEITSRRFVLMSYAHELKLRVQKDFDLRYEQLWGNDKEVNDLRYKKENGDYWTGREILQAYGQFFRSIDCDFWIKNLFNTIELKDYNNIIITDVRHINEADIIKDNKGFVILVTSDRDITKQVHGQTHISETALDEYNNFDLTIINNEGLQELQAAAKQAANFIISMKKLQKEI